MLCDRGGMTRDICSSGAFILAETVPPASCSIGLDVYLPSPDPGGRKLQLHGEGKVVRVEQQGQNKSGFAAEAMFQTELLPIDLTTSRAGETQDESEYRN
jgi:hypothetical protein